MSKEKIFSKSLQANKDFVDSLTKEQLENLMKPFHNYEIEQCDIHVVIVPKGTYCDFYKSECMKEFCSVTPYWQKCKYLK